MFEQNSIITFDSIRMGITLPPSGCLWPDLAVGGAGEICGFANIGVKTGTKSATNGSGAAKEC